MNRLWSHLVMVWGAHVWGQSMITAYLCWCTFLCIDLRAIVWLLKGAIQGCKPRDGRCITGYKLRVFAVDMFLWKSLPVRLSKSNLDTVQMQKFNSSLVGPIDDRALKLLIECVSLVCAGDMTGWHCRCGCNPKWKKWQSYEMKNLRMWSYMYVYLICRCVVICICVVLYAHIFELIGCSSFI